MNKSSLIDETKDYFGHIMWSGPVELAQYIADAFEELEYPTTRNELSSLLGFYRVFKRFVLTFARITAPLNNKI